MKQASDQGDHGGSMSDFEIVKCHYLFYHGINGSPSGGLRFDCDAEGNVLNEDDLPGPAKANLLLARQGIGYDKGVVETCEYTVWTVRCGGNGCKNTTTTTGRISESGWARKDHYGYYTGIYCPDCYKDNYPYRRDAYFDPAYAGESLE